MENKKCGSRQHLLLAVQSIFLVLFFITALTEACPDGYFNAYSVNRCIRLTENTTFENCQLRCRQNGDTFYGNVQNGFYREIATVYPFTYYNEYYYSYPPTPYNYSYGTWYWWANIRCNSAIQQWVSNLGEADESVYINYTMNPSVYSYMYTYDPTNTDCTKVADCVYIMYSSSITIQDSVTYFYDYTYVYEESCSTLRPCICALPAAPLAVDCNAPPDLLGTTWSAASSLNGSLATYTCLAALRFTDNSTETSALCFNGQWITPIHGCFPVCSKPSPGNQSYVYPDSNINPVTSKMSYICNEPYKFSIHYGGSTSYNVTCMNGNYSQTVVEGCYPTCPKFTTMFQNTTMFSRSFNLALDAVPQLGSIYIRCIAGYTFLDGVILKLIVCMNGNWTSVPDYGCYPVCAGAPFLSLSVCASL